jgi:hypothetical protein
MKLAFLLSGALLAAPASAQVYKCVDAAGKTIYLQSPCPPGQSSKVIISKPAAAAAEAPAAKAGGKPPPNPEQEFRKRQKEREEADKKSAEETAAAKRREENCQRARQQVAQYDLGGRQTGINDKGERYFLDDAQIAQSKARAQASVAEWCK